MLDSRFNISIAEKEGALPPLSLAEEEIENLEPEEKTSWLRVMRKEFSDWWNDVEEESLIPENTVHLGDSVGAFKELLALLDIKQGATSQGKIGEAPKNGTVDDRLSITESSFDVPADLSDEKIKEFFKILESVQQISNSKNQEAVVIVHGVKKRLSAVFTELHDVDNSLVKTKELIAEEIIPRGRDVDLTKLEGYDSDTGRVDMSETIDPETKKRTITVPLFKEKITKEIIKGVFRDKKLVDSDSLEEEAQNIIFTLFPKEMESYFTDDFVLACVNAFRNHEITIPSFDKFKEERRERVMKKLFIILENNLSQNDLKNGEWKDFLDKVEGYIQEGIILSTDKLFFKKHLQKQAKTCGLVIENLS
jgi:hypothetical protein